MDRSSISYLLCPINYKSHMHLIIANFPLKQISGYYENYFAGLKLARTIFVGIQ